MKCLRSAKIIAVFIVCGAVSFAHGASSRCTGHNCKTSWELRAPEPIQLTVKAKAGNNAEITIDASRSAEENFLGYVCACSGDKVTFQIAASDKDNHVCQGVVTGQVSNYILQNTTIIARILDANNVEVGRTNLVSSQPGDVISRLWTGAWTIPPGTTGQWLYVHFDGMVSDKHCPSHVPSIDEDVSLMPYVASLCVVEVEIAMDGNRDDFIDFDDPDDAKYLFWVNDDYDVMHWEEDMWHEDDDQSPDIDATPPILVDGPSVPRNCDDDYIGERAYSSALIVPHNCRRDLEDFTRLHIRVDDNTVNMAGITYWLKFENVVSGNPSVNIFEAIDESLVYLQNGTVADQQIQKTRLLTVDATERQLPSDYIETGNQRSPFILEGKAAGKGDLTIIVKKDGDRICKKAVTLELRPITKFYQVFRVATVGGNSTDVSAGYNPDFTSTDDYLLFVHGFNVGATEKAYWPGTVFKRLWWQGYKGHFGWFDWPCVVRRWWNFNPEFFDNSENIAWQCGTALLDRINQLNLGAHADKVRLIAHSQGNIIAGEALRNAGGFAVQAYIASQAAVAGDHYCVGLPQNPDSYSQPFPTTPNVLANYPLTGSPYLSGIFSHVGAIGVFDYINNTDFALRSGMFSWERNNAMKPDLNYWYHPVDGDVDTYAWPNEYFFYDDLWPGFRVLAFPDDRFEVYSYGAEARSFALGTDCIPGFTQFNLRTSPLNYNSAHYSHSRQLRSNIVDERKYWEKVMQDCNF